MNRHKLEIGDVFWEYNAELNSGYPRIAHSEIHIKYFYDGYGVRAFYTKEDLLEAHPEAVI